MTSVITLFGAFKKHNIRWNGDSDNPWWVAADVCSALGLTNVSMAVNGNPITGDLGLDDDEKDNIRILDTIGRSRKTIVVNEAGLYRLIFKSRKEEAKTFQRWVFHEVFPSIRKYGCYPAPALEEEAEWSWEAAILAFLLSLCSELGEEMEKNDCRVVATLGFAWLNGEDLSDEAIADFLKLDPLDVGERIAYLQDVGAVDADRLLLLPAEWIPQNTLVGHDATSQN